MRYNLSSSQSSRINFDEMVERLAEDALNAVPDEVQSIKMSANEYISDIWGVESEFINVDDVEEAEARFFSVFREVIGNA